MNMILDDLKPWKILYENGFPFETLNLDIRVLGEHNLGN
jgi:hypothetical protein